MRPYVEASHHPRRGTTAGQDAAQENHRLRDRGLMHTPYETSCRPKRGDQRIITSVQLNSRASHEQMITDLITPRRDLKAPVDGRMQPPKIHHRTTVSSSVNFNH